MISRVDLLHYLAQARKGSKGITFIEGERDESFLSYNALYDSAISIANTLRKKGVKEGDEIVFQVEKNRDFITVFWGCIAGGFIPVPVAVAMNQESRLRLQNVWKVLNNPWLVCNAKMFQRLAEKTAVDQAVATQMLEKALPVEQLRIAQSHALPERASAPGTAFIQFSSGSTGTPKGVVLTHTNLLTNINAIIKCSCLNENDSTLGWMPLTHDMGLIGFHLTPVVCGIDQYLMPASLFVRRPALWLQKVNDHKATFLASPNFGYKHFLAYYEPAQLQGWDLSHVRRILNGAEPISVALCDSFMETLAAVGLPKNAMFPVYGMAEASLAVTFPPISEDYSAVYVDRNQLQTGEEVKHIDKADANAVSFMSVGFPVTDCSVRIAAIDGNAESEGRIGFIQIRGANVTSGYYNNPEATAQAITADGWLNTGDLGFMLDGRLVITGRAKDVIFFNGQNYYAHDIERVAEELPGMEPGKIVACGITNMEEQKEEVLLFVQYRSKPEDFAEISIKLRTFISQKIALEVSHVIPVSAIPKTTSGKVQRYKLGQDYRSGEFRSVLEAVKRSEEQKAAARLYVAPRTETEKKVVALWKEVLKIDKVGVKDNFFELGGHSLKATLLLSLIHRDFGVELSLREVFKASTVEGLANTIEAKEGGAFRAIEKVSPRNFYPLSSAQRRLYILDQLEEKNTSYNIPVILSITGELSKDRVATVIGQLIQRHESFRTSFKIQNDKPVQFVHQDVVTEIEYTELSEDKADDFIRQFIRPFDLSKEPLLRAALIKTSATHHLLVLDMHHIVSDGTSVGILLREFVALYKGDQLPAVELDYKDFAAWQESSAEDEFLIVQENYWLEKFRGDVPVLELPLDHTRPAVSDHKGETIRFTIDAVLNQKLAKLSAETGATRYMIILAAYNVLLSRYSGQEDIVVGSPSAGRAHASVQDIVGVFINTLALRNHPARNKSFEEFLHEVKQNAMDAMFFEDYPVEQLVEKLQLPRDLGRNPLYDTVLIYQNMDLGAMNIPGLSVAEKQIDTGTAKFDLTMEVREKKETLDVSIEYATSLFRRETVLRMVQHFINILHAIVNDRTTAIGSIEIISEEEKHKLLNIYNNPVSDLTKHETIITLLQKQVSENPAQLVVCGDKQWTYRELNERANRWANLLRKRNIGREQLVAVLVPRSLEMHAVILGILKSGAAYLPLDAGYPADRINTILSDSGARAIITVAALKNNFTFTGDVLVTEEQSLDKEEPFNPQLINQPGDLAYVIYTSGSTGLPKGVMIEHRNLVSYFPNLGKTYGFTKSDSILALTTITFDISILELLCSVLTGMKVVIADDETVSDVRQLSSRIQKEKITVLQTTPSRLQLLLEASGKEALSSLRIILSGGEAMTESLAAQLLSLPGVTPVNVYGPTEATIWSTSLDLRKEALCIGKPSLDEKVYILSPSGMLQPEGVAGELCIGGRGVGRAYLNRPELTAEKFQEDPFTRGGRIYRTGDLACWLPGGNLKYLGRTDFQVKIRGYRIEPGEIENLLLLHPTVKQAAVLAKDDAQGVKYLCAYIGSDEPSEAAAIKEHLAAQLPEYMVPSHFVILPQLPLNSNGKINRKALPDPVIAANKREFVPPADATEIKLAGIWEDVMGLSPIGAEDNFFELGGHSLKGTVLTSCILREMQSEVPLRELFKNPTVRSLASYIRSQKQSAYTHLVPVEKKPYYPASASQKRLYVLAQIEDASTSYNMPGVFVLKGRLDVDRVKHVFARIAERHEVFRTSFDMIDGQTVQIVHDAAALDISVLGCSEGEALEMVRSLIKPFDLSKAPLLRVNVIRLGEDHHLLLCDMHHIISDGFSTEILVKEFTQLYEGKQVRELTLQYKDFAVWQEELFRSDAMKKQEVFWLGQFRDEVPVLDLPADFPRPAIQSYDGAIIRHIIDSEQLQSIKQLSRETGTSLYMIFLACFKVLLSKYTRQEDIVVGSPVAGRQHPDVQEMIGMFVNTLAIRSYPEGKKSFIQYLNEVKETVLSAHENQDFPFEELVEKLNIRRDMSRNPLFDTMFNYQDSTGGEMKAGEVRFSRYQLDAGISKFDLSLDVVEHPASAEFTFEFALRLFKPQTIQRLADHFANLVKAIAANPEAPLQNLGLLAPGEDTSLLSAFNNTYAHVPAHLTAIDLFEEQVKRVPGNIAVTFPSENGKATHLTYGELEEKANAFASVLIGKGIGKEDIIGVMTGRCEEMFISILAVWKAGAAYLPVDPAYPHDRIAHMLSDSGARILITQKHIANNAEFNGEKVLVSANELKGNTSIDLPPRDPSALAYIIYTSGSTGKPKGVMVEHSSLVNAAFAWRKEYKLDTTEVRLLQMASFSFDVFAGDLLRAFANGGQMVICPEALRLELPALVNLIETHKVTLFESTPGLILPLMEYAWEQKAALDSLEMLILGSDTCSRDNFILLQQRFGSRMRILNSYGVTEATIDSSYFEGEVVRAGNLPVGKPLQNTSFYILGEGDQLQPVGVPGELCIGGMGVARGYLNREDLTAEKFVNDPFIPGGRMYRTGDLARWLEDGNVEFIGRKDTQVKIRGYRVELGEIENRLLACRGVKEAVVIDKTDSTGTKYLCAYFTGTEASQASMKEELSKELPAYMIPAHIVQLDKLPLTSNNKIDRRALPEPVASEESRAIELPADVIEEQLAAVWQEVLKIQNVGVTDNFFSLGGDSIKAIQVVSRLRSHGLKLEVKDLFQQLTIRNLVPFIKNDEQRIDQGPVSGEVPLTPIQHAFYAEELSEPQFYTQGIVIFNSEGFEVSLVETVLHKLAEHHDALRMIFDSKNQVNRAVSEGSMFTLERFAVPAQADAAGYISEACATIQRAIDLHDGPLVRAALFNAADGDHLAIIIHHLVVDGVSWRILIEDFNTAYSEAKEGKQIKLPAKTTSFRHWAEKLAGYANTGDALKEYDYWKKVAGENIAALPSDFTPETNTYSDSKTALLELPVDSTEQLLKEVNQAYNTEINDILLTALALALKDWTGAGKINVLLEGHGREELFADADISRTVGWFTTMFPVVLEAKEGDTGTIIKHIKEDLRHIPSKGIGYGILRHLRSDASLEPVSKPAISFNYLGQFDEEQDGIMKVRPMSLAETVSPGNQRSCPIDINGMVTGGRLSIEFTYNSKEFNVATIDKFVSAYNLRLLDIISYCRTKDNTEITPSDLSYDIGLEEFENIFS